MAEYTMFRGDTFVLAVTVLKTDGSGTPQDISGWTVWFTMKRFLGDDDSLALAQCSTGALGGVALTDPTNGVATITAPAGATRSLPPNVMTIHYDVQTKDTAGRIRTQEAGTIVVTPDVTITTTP